MSTTTIHQIACDNGRTRLTIHQRQDGLFFYTEDSFEGWDDTPAMWRERYPPSGLFTTAEEAKAEAEAVLPWLQATRI